MYPTLIDHYDGQGNAILKLKGNVEGLTKALEEERLAAAQTSVDGMDKLLTNFNNESGNKKISTILGDVVSHPIKSIKAQSRNPDIGYGATEQGIVNVVKKFNSLNKEDYKIRDFDKAYCELLKDILKNGELFENRTGIDTLSVEGVNFKLDLGKEFPLLESKKVLLKNALSEMLWIYQAQTNDVSWLRERGNNIWNEWEVDSDGIYRIYESTTENYDKDKEVNVYDLDGNIIIGMKAKSNIEGKNIKAAKFYGKEYAGTIGTAYGYIINKYK